ncbi:MAG: hypothetical protein ACI9J3_000526 [Parvicellaceae bacterium]|jgi:hypothetical protein
MKNFFIYVLLVATIVTSSCTTDSADKAANLNQFNTEQSLVGEWNLNAIEIDTSTIPPMAALLLAMSHDDLNVYEFNMKNFIIKSEFDNSIFSVQSYRLSDEGNVLEIYDDEGNIEQLMMITNLAKDSFTVSGNGFTLEFESVE